MYVCNVMTTNVVTIPSSTSIIDAKRIMEAHRFRRLPVVDKGKLVGVITKDMLERVPIPKTTSRDIWELSYGFVSLYRTQVKKIMKKDVVTVAPDMTAEEALAVAQDNKVGALVVVEDNRVVGIATTNDFFYKIVNPVLGIGLPGSRIGVAGGGEGKPLEEIVSCINKHGLNITALHIIALPEATKKDVVVHVDSEDVSQLVTELRDKGYKVSLRKR
ncbi:CBS domain-containing protein [Chloroflexota bacterium]